MSVHRAVIAYLFVVCLVLVLGVVRHVLHNKRAALLKGLLLLRGDEDVVVINVPWYLTH